MLKIRILKVGQLKTNCYLVTDKKTGETIIIDPGDDGDYIAKSVIENNFRPLSVIASHGHFDHILASYEITTAFQIPLLLHKDDKFLLSKMRYSAKRFLNLDTDPPAKVNKFISEGDKIKIGNSLLLVLETPGHTPGSISLYSEEDKIIFVGDLIFEHGLVGRSDFSYSNKGLLKKSINKVLKLPEYTHVYPGHGNPFKIGNFTVLYKRNFQ